MTDLKAKSHHSLPVHTTTAPFFMLLLARHSHLPLSFQELESTFPDTTVFHRSNVLQLLMLPHDLDTLIYTRNLSWCPLFFQTHMYINIKIFWLKHYLFSLTTQLWNLTKYCVICITTCKQFTQLHRIHKQWLNSSQISLPSPTPPTPRLLQVHWLRITHEATSLETFSTKDTGSISWLHTPSETSCIVRGDNLTNILPAAEYQQSELSLWYQQGSHQEHQQATACNPHITPSLTSAKQNIHLDLSEFTYSKSSTHSVYLLY